VHKHTIDWYLQVNLTSDAELAERRSSTANAVAQKLSRDRVIELLRLFLFTPPSAEFAQQLTDELIALDTEFPVSNNAQELRMMAGLVMVTTFAQPSLERLAMAFALGLRAASFPAGRVKPIQPAILTEAEEYLRERAGRLRPNEFATDISAEVAETVTARLRALSDPAIGADEAKKTAALTAYRDAVPRAIASSHKELARRIEQLAEETALLWWVLGEYSDSLQQPVSKLDPESYALAAAAEAAQRTVRLPPSPSIGPLLRRVLQPCKSSEKKIELSDYLKATDSPWRASQLKSFNVADYRDLSPLCAAVEKTEELGSASAALKAVAKLCPGVKSDLPLAPAQAAQQFYNEIVFHRALSAGLN